MRDVFHKEGRLGGQIRRAGKRMLMRTAAAAASSHKTAAAGSRSIIA